MQKRKLYLGKISLGGKRKIYPVEVEIELKDTNKGPAFSASGVVWNSRKTDCYCAGQIFDSVKPYLKTRLFNEVYDLWNKYHLNDMHAGTARQEVLVREYLKTHENDYNKVCEYLKENNLYEDEGCKYGAAWYYHEIPAEDLERIKKLLVM